MKITFELEPEDVERFQSALADARDAVRSADEGELIDCAKHSLDRLPLGVAPLYVRGRIGQVQRLIAMLEDEEWALPAALRQEVLSALVYFSDPEDMIPDGLPVIGLLDDAIMLEMLLREERDLLAAYDAFCEFRRALGPLPDDLDFRTVWCAKLKQERQRLIAPLKTSRHI
ncbi:MAG: YkvA family protein [Gammaproteobacteria bacterium]